MGPAENLLRIELISKVFVFSLGLEILRSCKILVRVIFVLDGRFFTYF